MNSRTNLRTEKITTWPPKFTTPPEYRSCWHSGAFDFESWSRQDGSALQKLRDRSLGPFDPNMTAETAIEKLEIWKLTQQAQTLFKQGWEDAQAAYQRHMQQCQSKSTA